MKITRLILLVVAIALGVMTAMGIVTNDNARNTRDLIYTPRHLLNEVMILMVALFLIVEASDHIAAETCRDLRHNGNRYARILAGAGLITVHVAVLVHGGYAP